MKILLSIAKPLWYCVDMKTNATLKVNQTDEVNQVANEVIPAGTRIEARIWDMYKGYAFIRSEGGLRRSYVSVSDISFDA